MTFHFHLQDAHICSLDFDKSTSLFAVFDGHGGSEVALYCSKKLPEFLKSTEAYKKTDYERALKDAFLGFDATLVDEEIIKELKQLIPADKLDGETSDEDMEDYEEDLTELRQESRMPLNELLEKIKEAKNIPLNKLKQGEASGAKPLSPFLRGRRNGPSADGSAQNGQSTASVTPKRLADLDAADEKEAVSSSSASADVEKGQSADEPTSSSITAGDASQIAGSTSDANPDNGPSSSSGGDDAGSSSKIDSASSPVSSSTTNKKDENPIEPSSELNKVNEPSESHADAAADGGNSNSPLKKVEAEENGKVESVSSSSAAENGVVASSDAAKPGQTEKAQNTISSSAKLPSLNDSDDSSSDGSYAEEGVENEAASDDDDDDDEENDEEEDDDELEDDDDEEESDEEMNAQDYEDDERFLNNMIEGPGSSSGCTAVVALLAGNELYVANAGDSRCVVCRNGTALDMSLDHKPEDTEELERIQKAGGRVTLDGRVNGGLNLSRAIGDHAYKTVSAIHT